MDLWHAIGEQLRHPRGLGGRLVGRAMGWANARPTRLAVEALDLSPGDDVLDVGCGNGHAVALIAALLRDGTVTGVDQSDVMIDQARAANRRAILNGKARLTVGDFNALPFPPASFDRVLAANVIYFWRNPAGMIAQLRGLMRPGGRLVIYATCESSMRRWKFAAGDTHRWIDRASLTAALIEGGFAPDNITLTEVHLPAGIEGMIAVATA